jgi:hypothetical protein
MKTHSAFTFAILTDSHIRLPKESNGPDDYPSNQLFNARNRYAVRQINHLSPSFVVHLGDIPHPIPALPDFKPAMLAAQAIFRDFDSKLYVLPGNHDVGDKPNAWTPAPVVSHENLSTFEDIWGSSFQAFDKQDCRFYLINSPILNSGLQCEEDQRQWLESDLEANQKTGKRVFWFTHYPLYLHHPDEGEHYDNISQPARSWLLKLLEKYSVHAVFTGHTHNFFYNRYRNSDLYVLPSIAFVRPEFSELSHIEPALEYGRNDFDKLGFFFVHVDQGGHQVVPIRTRGLTEEGQVPIEPFPNTLSGDRLPVVISPVGISLRHSWASTSKLPFDNLDEFTRKQVRNDYPLLGMLELGIRNLRLPLSDLEDEETRTRMRALRPLGFCFNIFSIGLPDDKVKAKLIRHRDLVDCWEIIATRSQIPGVIDWIREVKRNMDNTILLSQFDTIADQKSKQVFHFSHFPSHGFRLSDRNLIATYLQHHSPPETIDGFVFRLSPDIYPWDGIETAVAITNELGTKASIHVQMPRASEGEAFVQDEIISNRTAETLIASLYFQDAAVYVDTFIDHDRGYYPRNGLLDRRSNPRPAFHIFRNLQRALGNPLSTSEWFPSISWPHFVASPDFQTRAAVSSGIRSITLESPQIRYTLALNGEGVEHSEPRLTIETNIDHKARTVKTMNLLTGEVVDV